jgi:hypothetical protein
VGLVNPDAVGTAKPDVITILDVPDGARVSTTAAVVSGSAPTLVVTNVPGCPVGTPLCGLAAGMTIVIFDSTGQHGLYRIASLAGVVAQLEAMQGASPTFAVGARVAPVESRTFYFDAANRELRLYDGYRSDMPVVDDVVDVRFEFHGDAEPPAGPRPPLGTANCLYDVAGVPTSGLPTLATEGGSLAPLPLALFSDGPWCGTGDRRFDADLLRIRSVRLVVRLQAALDRFRGAGALYRIAGTNQSPASVVPDMTLVVEISPRNLNRGR